MSSFENKLVPLGVTEFETPKLTISACLEACFISVSVCQKEMSFVN